MEEKSADRTTVCPRCGGGIPNSDQVGLYPGALSRIGHNNYVCSSCGTKEALWQFYSKLPLPPLDVEIVLDLPEWETE
jgi:DNA-directed RNA polymerase subunit RPC12/RpoP